MHVARYGFRTFLKNEFSGLEFDPPTQLLGMQLPANSKSLLCLLNVMLRWGWTHHW